MIKESTLSELTRKTRIKLYNWILTYPLIGASLLISKFKERSEEGEVNFVIPAFNSQVTISRYEYLAVGIAYAITSAILCWYIGKVVAVRNFNRHLTDLSPD